MTELRTNGERENTWKKENVKVESALEAKEEEEALAEQRRRGWLYGLEVSYNANSSGDAPMDVEATDIAGMSESTYSTPNEGWFSCRPAAGSFKKQLFSLQPVSPMATTSSVPAVTVSWSTSFRDFVVLCQEQPSTSNFKLAGPVIILGTMVPAPLVSPSNPSRETIRCFVAVRATVPVKVNCTLENAPAEAGSYAKCVRVRPGTEGETAMAANAIEFAALAVSP